MGKYAIACLGGEEDILESLPMVLAVEVNVREVVVREIDDGLRRWHVANVLVEENMFLNWGDIIIWEATYVL